MSLQVSYLTPASPGIYLTAMNLFTGIPSIWALWNPWGRWALIALTVAVFVLATVFPQFPGDEWALLQFQSLQTPWLTAIGKALSQVGSAPVAIGLTISAVVVLSLTQRLTDAKVALLGGLFIIGGIALKFVVERPRPDYFLVDTVLKLSSFPSGHAVFAAIFCGVAILVIQDWVQHPVTRRSLQVALLLLVLVMGASRVYLGFHWPSDVLGAYLYSAIVLGELIWIRKRLVSKQTD